MPDRYAPPLARGPRHWVLTPAARVGLPVCDRSGCSMSKYATTNRGPIGRDSSPDTVGFCMIGQYDPPVSKGGRGLGLGRGPGLALRGMLAQPGPPRGPGLILRPNRDIRLSWHMLPFDTVGYIHEILAHTGLIVVRLNDDMLNGSTVLTNHGIGRKGHFRDLIF